MSYNKYKKKDLIKLCKEYENHIDLVTQEMELLKIELENKSKEFDKIFVIPNEEKKLNKKEQFLNNQIKYIKKRYDITSKKMYFDELNRIN